MFDTHELVVIPLFQTNPCGVEANDGNVYVHDTSGFRRTLVGLKRYMQTELGISTEVSDEPLWG